MMDRPECRVSWLETFPPDIWAYFVSYLLGEDVGRLMMTGATLLRQRVKSPGVLKSIWLGEDLTIRKSLPMFLNDLPSLEGLSIYSSGDEWSLALGLRIDLIPSGVRKLELSGTWEKSAAKLFGEGGTTLKLCEHLPHLQVLNIKDLNLANYSWTTCSPQSLTKLSIYRWDGTVELPSSLIHLKASTVALSKVSFVSKLPPLLESFVVVREFDGFDLVVPLLPPALLKLSLGDRAKLSYGSPLSPQNVLEQLPQSLTWFRVPGFNDFNFVTNPELISLLPATLTTLLLNVLLPCSAWTLLPRQITRLHSVALISLPTAVSGNGELSKAPSVPFDSLPRSITNLDLLCADSCFCGIPAVCNGSFFPPQITTLKITDFQLSPDATKLLPPSLTDLEIGNFCERVCQHLPHRLTKLVSFNTWMSPNLIKYLPKSLTDLILSLVHDRRYWFDYSTGKKVDSTSEEHSRNEKCLSTSFDWKEVSPLPPRLRHLYLGEYQTLGNSFMMHQHLPDLTDLNLNDSKHFTDLSIPFLPAHLKVLKLKSSREISGKSFKFLPRCLQYLDLATSESIFDSDIQHLPQTLSMAYLNNAIHLTDLCIPDLPPQMRFFCVSKNTHISSSSFPNFPKLYVHRKVAN